MEIKLGECFESYWKDYFERNYCERSAGKLWKSFSFFISVIIIIIKGNLN